MTEDENSQTTITESSVSSNSAVNPHTGIDPTKHVGVLRVRPAELEASQKLELDLTHDSFFPNTESFIVIQGWRALEPVIKEDSIKVQKYNDLLKEKNINYHIRHKHLIQIRRTVYLYTGMYIYQKEVVITPPEKPQFIAPKGEQPEDSTYCNGCYKWVKDNQLSRHNKAKSHKEAMALLVASPKKETKLQYLQRFNPYEWRAMLGETTFKEVGTPPKLDLPSVKYRRIMINGEETDTIILPGSVWLISDVQKIFMGYPVFRLS